MLQLILNFFQDLENYIRNHTDSHYKKLQEIGQQLINNEIMSQSIKSDLDSLTARRENLNKQVSKAPFPLKHELLYASLCFSY